MTTMLATSKKAKKLGLQLKALSDRRAEKVEECKALAIELHGAGVTEVELAKLFGVDRARTIRRWLGKMTD